MRELRILCDFEILVDPYFDMIRLVEANHLRAGRKIPKLLIQYLKALQSLNDMFDSIVCGGCGFFEKSGR